eukprot:TRINITY_DN1205_c0_g1_i4.p1 TRINITY_DN1205_c0_g1~~TRINITY_DN1205_c0_g1_i4.p1  ORF type:complete len:863 (-),score=138.81 TRINITY_DN1205_c0_g1_i4:162-2750(-)
MQPQHKIFDSIQILPLCGPPEVQKLRNNFRLKKLKWQTHEEENNNNCFYYPPDKLTPYQLTPQKQQCIEGQEQEQGQEQELQENAQRGQQLEENVQKMEEKNTSGLSSESQSKITQGQEQGLQENAQREQLGSHLGFGGLQARSFWVPPQKIPKFLKTKLQEFKILKTFRSVRLLKNQHEFSNWLRRYNINFEQQTSKTLQFFLPQKFGGPFFGRFGWGQQQSEPNVQKMEGQDKNGIFSGAWLSEESSRQQDTTQNEDQKMPEFALTENRAVAHANTGSECLDFFYQVVPGTSYHRIFELLDKAWPSDSELCLKLIFQLGATRKGKSDRFSFYHSLYWLYKNHPATLLHNLHIVEKAVYFKALIELLAYIVEQEKNGLYLRRQNAIEQKIKAGGKIATKVWIGKKGKGKKQKLHGTTPTSETTPQFKTEVSKRLDFPKEQWEHQILRVVKKYDSDAVFRTAHNLICQIFVEYLKKDLDNYNQGKISCSLAAKWVPNLNSGYEYRTLLCEGIARRLFPKSLPEYVDLDEQFYSYRVRDRLRKEVLVPLRKHLKVPEIFMSQNQWSDLDYTRVPSVCMRLRKNQFLKHDGERLNAFLEKVEKGEKKMASQALKPHEILRDVNKSENSDESSLQISQLQWESLIQNIKGNNQLNNCVAVCDVSGSMSFHSPTGVTCMEVAIALTLIISEVAQEPWKDHAITFSESPSFQNISGKTLKERYESLEKIDFGFNTDFQKVFDEILKRAQQASLPPEQMVGTLFVFSDMQFDEAAGMYHINTWKTSHQLLKEKFRDAGYPMPKIVYWNLRSTDNVPVQKDEMGTCLLSGFSANLLKMFMEGTLEDFNPMEVMLKAVSGRLFEQLEVVD